MARARTRTTIAVIFAATVVALGLLLWLWPEEPTTEVRLAPPSNTLRDAPTPRLKSRAAPRQENSRTLTNQESSDETETADESCEPYTQLGCYAGDVYWFDACGNVQRLSEDCTGFCSDGKCVESNWTAQCSEPPEGRCSDDTLVFCDLGETARVDCAAKGKVCRPGREGASCVVPPEEDACAPSPPRCDDNVLELCVAGRWEKTDCEQLGGSCEAIAGSARCTRPVREPEGGFDPVCGACGCEPSPTDTEETCNGLDDDNNRFVDDGISCGVVTIDVLVGEGAHGEQLIDAAGLQAEIEFTNGIFADSGSFIRFQLGEVRPLQLDNAQSPEIRDLAPLLESSKGAADSDDLVLQLVFVQRLLEDEVPRLGVAFPFVTSRCGEILEPTGRRRDEALLAISERRVPTTLAHELGHLLGLCHTHERLRPGSVAVAPSETDEEEICGEECSFGGDAICDTPDDDEACSYLPATCETQCPELQQPDTSNVMSYYHACRHRFSSEQVQVMEHTLALRRQWFRCRDGACECKPGKSDCPSGMSCRPGRVPAEPFRCGMDGPVDPGQSCKHHSDCNGNSLCLEFEAQLKCTRTCSASRPDCSCDPTNLETISVCREDLLGAEAERPEDPQQPVE